MILSRRKTAIIIGMTFVCLQIFSGCGKSTMAPQAEVILRIGVSTADSDPRNVCAKQFADEISKKSDGTLKAVIYPSGQLGGDADMIELMNSDSGKIDIVITDASNFATYEPKMGISALPFLFDDFDTAWAFMDSDVEAEAESLLIDDNMRVLAHYDNGFRCVTTSKKPVNSPEDMNGLIIRTPQNPVIMATMAALGADPQPLSFAELYEALEKGTYDAQENPVPVIYNNKLYEVQNYLAVTNHIYSGMCFTIKESTWKSLSAQQQEIIMEAAQNSAAEDRRINKLQTESLLETLKEQGMEITYPDLESFAAKTSKVINDDADVYGNLTDKLYEWLKEH